MAKVKKFLLLIFSFLLLTCARERISVFTCATDDYCPLWRHLARQRDGILFSDAQSLDHRTVPCVADATKIV